MAGAAPPLIPMRDGANRSFGYAILASILLHALLLLALPSLRRLPQAPMPLNAHLVQAQPKPEPVAPVEELRKPPVPEARPVTPRAVAKPAPVPQAPLPEPAPLRAVVSEPAPPAPPTPITPAAAGPVARFEPQSAATTPVGPDAGVMDRYRLQILTAAARFKRYPRSAIDNNWEGEVVVRMTIGADGRIAALGIKTSSGHEMLDRQALEMFRIAKPFVQLPPELAGKEFELELRAIYSLKDQASG